MLIRSDPLRELERWTQLLGTPARPTVMPIDAWREGDQFIVEFDLPGVASESLNLDVERNVLTVHAERPELEAGREMLSAERPRGGVQPPVVPRGEPRHRPHPGELSGRGAAAGHPDRRGGQAATHRGHPQPSETGDRHLTASATHS